MQKSRKSVWLFYARFSSLLFADDISPMETLNPSNFALIFDHIGYLDIFYTSRMIENQKNIVFWTIGGYRNNAIWESYSST